MKTIHPTAIIHEDAVIGEGVVIEEFVVVRARAQVREGTVIKAYVLIGEGAYIGRECSIGAYTEVRADCVIGDRVRLGSKCLLADGTALGKGGHFSGRFTTCNKPEPGQHRPSVVQPNVYAGVGVTLMPNICIGEGAKIGASSTVRHNIPDGEVWFGNPAKRYK